MSFTIDVGEYQFRRTKSSPGPLDNGRACVFFLPVQAYPSWPFRSVGACDKTHCDIHRRQGVAKEPMRSR